MKTTRGALTSGIVSLFLIMMGSGCSGDNGSSNANTTGRGTPTCNDWQSAYCGWLAKCQGPAVACDQAKSIYCKSDAEAKRCADALASSACSSSPEKCELTDLADPAPAAKACENFGVILCQREEVCQRGTKEACLDLFKNVLDCTRAIGVSLGYEQCMSEFPNIPCASMSGPPVCIGVLLLK